jgi:hypothetical protein
MDGVVCMQAARGNDSIMNKTQKDRMRSSHMEWPLDRIAGIQQHCKAAWPLDCIAGMLKHCKAAWPLA